MLFASLSSKMTRCFVITKKIAFFAIPNLLIVAILHRHISNTGVKNHEETSLVTNFGEAMKERVDHIHAVCNEGINSTTPLSDQTVLIAPHMYFLAKEQIAYCPTYKSASSVWLTNLVDLSDAEDRVKRTARQRYKSFFPDQAEYVGAFHPSSTNWTNYVLSLDDLHNLTAFMIVRHPFERLVSAYRDKLGRLDQHYYDTYGKWIVRRFREKAIQTFGGDFLTKVHKLQAALEMSDAGSRNDFLPSFWEFVQSVKIQLNMDEHWRPMYEYCSICNPVQQKAFRYFLKFEDLENEESQFLSLLQWDKKVNRTLRINVNRPGYLSSAKITELYFSVLSEEDVLQLYRVYKYDFLLFNYKFKFGDLTVP